MQSAGEEGEKAMWKTMGLGDSGEAEDAKTYIVAGGEGGGK